MRVDVENSQYHEADDLSEFSRAEKKHARILLRRLRFLETQIREGGGLKDGSASGGAAFAEWEADALEWVLTDVGFLRESDSTERESV